MTASAPAAAASTPAARTYIVTSTADDPNAVSGSTQCLTAANACTLRAAIQAADAGAGPAVIDFDIPGTGVQIISPAAVLPTVSVPTTIDGYTQPGSTPATASHPATLDIALVGYNPAGPYVGSGLDFGPGSSGSVLEGLSVSMFRGAGVLLQSDGDTVRGTDLGAPAFTPSAPFTLTLFRLMMSPGNVTGLEIDHARDEKIGGTDPAQTNYISRNRTDGVLDDGGAANLISGNVIGPSPTWSTSPSLGFSGNLSAGLHLQGATGDTVSGNIVSSNAGYGIQVDGASGTDIAGNLVGISPDRESAMGNGDWGISVSSSAGTMIGGSNPAQRNVIAGSAGDGVLVTGGAGQGATIEGNYIGTDPTGQKSGSSYGSGWNSIEVSAPGTVVGAPGAGNVIDDSGQSYGAGPYADINVTPAGSGTVIQGNYIGLPADGQIQGVDSGLGIYSQAPDVRVGGSYAGDGNVIDTYLTSVQSNGPDAVIQGNLIGTDPTGTTGQASSQYNNSAIVVTGSGTLVGGDAPQAPPAAGPRICLPGDDPSGGCSPQLGPRNVIDNVGQYSGQGIAVGTATRGATVTGVRVMGNLIGTDITGTRALGLQECDVVVGDGAENTQIGGPAPGEGNVVAASGVHGIQVGPTAGSGNPTVGTVIQGNLVGTDLTGTRAFPDQEGGIDVLASSSGTLIGGPGTSARNVISGSPTGVYLDGGTTTTIEGNLVGTDATGLRALSGSGVGIVVNSGVSGTSIEDNVVSGNSKGGILGQGGVGTKLLGNRIGTTAWGTPLPNGGYGVHLAVDAQVGSVKPGEGNVIADNQGPGVDVGPGVTSDTIRGNSVTANTGLGIQLDPSVAAAAPVPALDKPAWSDNHLIVTGKVSGAPSSTYQVDVYTDPTPVNGDQPQGRTYLGSVAATTDSKGNADFSLAGWPPSPWTPGVLTATATNPAGETSEFSAAAPFGADPWSPPAPPTPTPPPVTTPPRPPTNQPPAGGYLLTDSAGDVFGFGEATHGSLAGTHLAAPIVGMATDACTGGYWLAGSDGGVFAFDAPFDGSMGSDHLTSPIVGIAPYARYDSTGRPVSCGYWLVASDGGVFAFNAPFRGSTGGLHLDRPVVGMAADPLTGGYWLVASDGGVFAFNAPFQGSTGGLYLNRPVVGMAADPLTGGYWLVASDGGVFAFGAPFHGSTGGLSLAQPVTAIQPDAAGTGYWLIGADGGVFSFGGAPFLGSVPGGPARAVGTVAG